jgi:hypothetical protein
VHHSKFGRSTSSLGQWAPFSRCPWRVRYIFDSGKIAAAQKAIQIAAGNIGFIDLRPDNPGVADPEVRRFAVGRLQRLERMGLAKAAGPGQSMVGFEAESKTLRPWCGQRSWTA